MKIWNKKNCVRPTKQRKWDVWLWCFEMRCAYRVNGVRGTGDKYQFDLIHLLLREEKKTNFHCEWECIRRCRLICRYHCGDGCCCCCIFVSTRQCRIVTRDNIIHAYYVLWLVCWQHSLHKMLYKIMRSAVIRKRWVRVWIQAKFGICMKSCKIVIIIIISYFSPAKHSFPLENTDGKQLNIGIDHRCRRACYSGFKL